jgi:hypothetical protein
MESAVPLSAEAAAGWTPLARCWIRRMMIRDMIWISPFDIGHAVDVGNGIRHNPAKKAPDAGDG